MRIFVKVIYNKHLLTSTVLDGKHIHSTLLDKKQTFSMMSPQVVYQEYIVKNNSKYTLQSLRQLKNDDEYIIEFEDTDD